MDKSETSLSLNLHITYPSLLVLKSAVDDAIERQQKLRVHLESESMEPGQNAGISIVMGILPDAGTGSESDKEDNSPLVFRDDDVKTNGLSDERLNGHSVSRAEEIGEVPNSGYSSELVGVLQEITFGESELSARQREVLELLSQGDSNQDIASKLRISPNTAKTHVRNIMSKLNAANRTQAALAAQTLLKKG